MSCIPNSSKVFNNLKSLIKHLENNPSSIIHLEGLDEEHIAFLKAARHQCWNHIPENKKNLDIFIRFPYPEEIPQIGAKMNEDLYWKSGKYRFNYFRYIDNKNKTFKMCLDAFKHDKNFIEYFPNEFKNIFYPTFERTQSWNNDIKKLVIDDINNIINCTTNNVKTCNSYINKKFEVIDNINTVVNKSDMLLQIVMKKGRSLNYIPEKYITLEMCRCAVAEDPNNIKYVPPRFATKELISFAMSLPRSPLFALADFFSELEDEEKTPEVCEAAVYGSGSNILHVPEQYLTTQLCLIAAKRDGDSLLCIPEHMLTLEVCIEAVKFFGENLAFVPETLKRYELCLLAVSKNGKALQYVPEKLKTKELCNLALENSICAISYCPEEMITNELVYNLITDAPENIISIPKKFRTEELWKYAFKIDPSIIIYMPEKYITSDMVDDAICYFPRCFDYIPNKYKTPELCLRMINTYVDSFKHIPDELKSPEICTIAIRNGGLNHIENIPQNILSSEIYYEIVKKHWSYFYKVPINFRTIPMMKLHFVNEPFSSEIDDAVFEDDEILSLISKVFYRNVDIPIKKHIKNPKYWFGIGMKFGSKLIPTNIPCGPYKFI